MSAQNYYKKNLYCTVSTVCHDGRPWASPLFFGYDDEGTMYVRSGKDAQHMINMREKPDAFVVIFDSTQPLGKGDGLYVQCAAQELSTQEEVQHALTCMELRGAKSVDAAMFIGEGSKRIVKLVPQTAWRNVITVTEAGYRDTREEVAIV